MIILDKTKEIIQSHVSVMFIRFARSITDVLIYIADTNNNRIWRVAPDGIITTVAGNGTAGFSGDSGPATSAMLNYPYGIEAGPDGSLYIADSNNRRVRRVTPDGIITTIAGNGLAVLSKRVTCHTFRHSCATHMVRNKAGLRHVQEMLGHSSLNTTQKYIQLTIVDLKEAHKKYHLREREKE